MTVVVAVLLQQGAEELGADRQAQGDLGQLPGHHPLMKDGMSDEGVCSLPGPPPRARAADPWWCSHKTNQSVPKKGQQLFVAVCFDN